VRDSLGAELRVRRQIVEVLLAGEDRHRQHVLARRDRAVVEIGERTRWVHGHVEVEHVIVSPGRMHLDVIGDKAELLSLGATMVRARDEEIDWDILADPEGNEFCVFSPQPQP